MSFNAGDGKKDNDQGKAVPEHRKVMEDRLLPTGWEKEEDGVFRCQKDSLLLRIFHGENVLFLALNEQKGDLRSVLLSINYRGITGLGHLLKELNALQKAVSSQNYRVFLKNLVYIHSDEVALRLGERGWQTLNAIDATIFSDDTEANVDPGRWYNQGQMYKRAGQYTQAIEAFRRAADLEPEMAEAWHNIGFSLLALGQTEQAARTLATAGGEYSRRLDRYPFNAYNQFWLACVYSLLKDKQQALENLARAIELNPDYRNEASVEEDLTWLWWDRDFLRLIGGAGKA